jgi:hypothetical protein
VFSNERNAEPLHEGATERFVFVCFPRAQPMIQVRSTGKDDVAAIVQRSKDEKQRDRVAAAGQRHHEARRTRRRTLTLNRAEDARGEGGHLQIGELVNW